VPIPGPIPRPQQVEREVARTRHDELEREWSRHRTEAELEPNRLLKWWRRLFGEEPIPPEPNPHGE